MRTYEADVTVLGGLPVTVSFHVSFDEPDVGYIGGVDEWWITHVNGRATKAEWLEKRIYAKDGEEARLCEQLMREVDWDDGYE